MRLWRALPLQAGLLADARALPAAQRRGTVEKAALGALAERSCEHLWIAGLAAGEACAAVAQTAAGLRAAEEQRLALDRAIAAGDLVLDQSTDAASGNEQATVHGVAQSFVPARDGACPVVRLYASTRNWQGAMPPLQVEIRADGSNNAPGETVCGRAEVPALGFGHEPTYRWMTARFNPPVRLAKGTRYWIHLSMSGPATGSYLWRMIKNAGNASAHAWSSRYDYTAHAWVYQVYLSKGEATDGPGPAR